MRRKGFTLVELLIVIIIIGILAAAMLLSSGAATASAEASNIVSNLRSLKSASILFFADNQDDMGEIPSMSKYTDDEDVSEIKDTFARYTDRPSNPDWVNYKWHHPGGTDEAWSERTWFIKGPAVGNPAVGQRLEARKDAIGLYKEATANPKDPDYDGGADIYILVRGPYVEEVSNP